MTSQGEGADRTAAQAEMLANRVGKNLKKLAPWARRHGVFAYRVYDCDIPELPFSLDRYEVETGEVHAVLNWFEGRFPHDDAWLEAMRLAAARALAIPHERVRLKHRARQEGTKQYERLGAADRLHRVREDGLTFLVDLDGYIDTGLFLDHRITRGLVRAECAGKDVLNLFAYTGAFTVHAAAGGARSTTTVDLSQTYCDWARDNLAANGLASPAHRIVRADVLRFLDEDTARYDLIVLDPPTFSNSKKMEGVLDVQRDHVRLLEGARRALRPGGAVYFSTNFRRFKPDEAAMARLYERVEEVTKKTIPFDFRDDRIHRCWRLTAGPG